MAEDFDDTGEERIVFAMLVGAVFGAALGTTVLQDTTTGIVTGVAVGSLAALVFPTWTDRLFEKVTESLEE